MTKLHRFTFRGQIVWPQKVKPYKIIKIDQNITKVNQSQEHTSCSGENILLNFFTFFSEKYLHLMYMCVQVFVKFFFENFNFRPKICTSDLFFTLLHMCECSGLLHVHMCTRIFILKIITSVQLQHFTGKPRARLI